MNRFAFKQNSPSDRASFRHDGTILHVLHDLPWHATTGDVKKSRSFRIGVLSGSAVDDQDNKVRLAAFQQRLQQLGWTDGHDVRIDYRFAAGNPENYRKYAAELVALAPDVILAPGGSLAPMLQATRTVPIVFAFAVDPVGSGFVESMSRPGGATTKRC
jgi:putative tryptophan/tyrosine transport system substrate-binding protein